MLITLVTASFLLFSQDITWYCKKDFKFYELKSSYHCSEKGKGPAFCKLPGRTKPAKCKANFFIEGGEIKVSYPGASGKKQTIRIGSAQFKPETTRSSRSESSPRTNRRNQGRDRVEGDGETTSGRGFNLFGRKNNRSATGLLQKYLPRKAGFTTNRSEARAWANGDWNNLSLVDRGKHIYEVAEYLIQAHGYTVYKPAHIVCKAYNESTFDPQIKASTSTASGLSQVTKTTAIDMTKRYGWPRSIVPGFEEIRSGEQFRTKMAANVAAQIEAGMFVLELKKKDFGGKTPYNLLYNYYGKSPKDNKSYASKITNCANCIGNGNITKCCLDKAKGLCNR